jgi:acyl carrier protein
MDINQFVMDFAECFDDTDASEFSSNLRFKELEEWSSLSGLGIIAMCKKKFGVKITGAEIMESDTIQDVYDLVMEKRG